jgi:hypothetical protein
MRRRFKKARKEIDLRKEFKELIFEDTPHNYPVLLRKRKKDASGVDIKCNCLNALTQESNVETNCEFCLGEGFLWKETFSRCYSSLIGADGGKANRNRRIMAGEIRTDYKLFYFKFDTEISYKDKIVELRLDYEGAPSIPYERIRIFRPETIQEYRADFGRTEYLAVYAREESSIRKNL